MINTEPLGGLQHIVNTQRTNRMHLIAHDHYNTQCGDRCDLADNWAARNLITPRAFLTAARRHQRLDDIAADLWTTREIVAAYISQLGPDEWLIMTRLVGHELY